MPLPWNRGDGPRRPTRLVDLLPFVGDSTGNRSGNDGQERSEPLLVAPHRDPGENAENHDVPPRFKRARGPAGAREQALPPRADASDPSASDAPASPDVAPGAGSTVTTKDTDDEVSPESTTPGAVSLDAVTSGATEPDEPAPDAEEVSPETAGPAGVAAPAALDTAGNETGAAEEKPAEIVDPESDSAGSEDSESDSAESTDAMTVHNE